MGIATSCKKCSQVAGGLMQRRTNISDVISIDHVITNANMLHFSSSFLGIRSFSSLLDSLGIRARYEAAYPGEINLCHSSSSQQPHICRLVVTT